ncbi:piwi-like protein 1 [Stylonychia lemnae]|uniref:Piwi-like protein 1 n=1 Tax=Stylonychia lemnae TaxID=5949 RepID=A0A078B1A0_STYLE|nr:piwi-like protein 1 [Stylonychia lemnae]|eukprot:CDW88329.1 piwi-like protein 1 [Stylonychia lemnae]
MERRQGRSNNQQQNRNNNNQRFNDRPKTSLSAASTQEVMIYTNQFKVNIKKNMAVYQYEVIVTPSVQETQEYHDIMHAARKSFCLSIGTYTVSGRTIFTPVDLGEDVTVDLDIYGKKYEIVINASSKVSFNQNSLGEIGMNDRIQVMNLINNILKNALRGMDNLRQIGKLPKFFDESQGRSFYDGLIQSCPGFRASAFSYSTQMAVVLDSVNKFIYNKTCLEIIREIEEDETINPKDVRQIILDEFMFKSVIGKWGQKIPYLVLDVIFDKDPYTFTFVDKNGDTVTMAEYFKSKIEIENKRNDPKSLRSKPLNPKLEKNQPLFLVKMNGKEVHVPPELCIVDKLPNSISNDFNTMRELLTSSRKTPNQKFNAIEGFSKKLFAQKILKEWGIEVDMKPMEFKSKVLESPLVQLGDGTEKICQQNDFRALSIQNSVTLTDSQWILAFDQRSRTLGQKVEDMLYLASQKLGMTVEYSHKMELKNTRDCSEFKRELQAYIKTYGKPIIVVFIIPKDDKYKDFKKICYDESVKSQVISFKIANKIEPSIASNILKQINSKLGGDLFKIKFSKNVNKKTMVCGIDVCHAGNKSTVGFCATINKEMSQYYSNKIYQAKKTEIVSKQLKALIKQALQSYENLNDSYPEHIIIYRDGVGDQQRRDVLQSEVTQFKDAINETYNKSSNKPKITVIVVNKRINQRFFIENHNQDLENPPSGCVIDSTTVGEITSNQDFDFYLIPQKTTQGTVIPTHFYVIYNDSPLDRATIEKLTFDLCFYYFNWSGAIKVPAPCMYAHKIAELYSTLQHNKTTDDLDIQQSLHFL